MLPKPLVRRVLDRDDHTCVLAIPGVCIGEATVADHRANRGSGGSRVLDDVVDLVAACGLCNGAKEDARGDLRALLTRRGLIVPRDSTNDRTLLRAWMTPVQWPDGSWWWLTKEGCRVAASDRDHERLIWEVAS